MWNKSINVKIDIKQLNKMGNVEQIHAHMKYDIQSICFAEHWGRNDYSLNYIEKKIIVGKQYSMNIFTFQQSLGFITERQTFIGS